MLGGLSGSEFTKLVKQLREIEQIERLEVDFDGVLEDDEHYNKFLMPYSYFMGKLTLKRRGESKLIQDCDFAEVAGLLRFLETLDNPGLRIKMLKEILKNELLLRKLARISEIEEDNNRPKYRNPTINQKNIL